MIDSGSVEYCEEDGRTYQKDTYSFREALDINRVVGVYIEDLFIPVN